MTETPRDPHPPAYGPGSRNYRTSQPPKGYSKAELIEGGRSLAGSSTSSYVSSKDVAGTGGLKAVVSNRPTKTHNGLDAL